MRKVAARSVGMSSLTYKPDLPIELLLPNGFPCVECLVFPNCSSTCGQLEGDYDKLTYLIIEKKICPDCGEKPRPRKFMRNASIYRCKGCRHQFIRLIRDDGEEWNRFHEDKK